MINSGHFFVPLPFPQVGRGRLYLYEYCTLPAERDKGAFLRGRKKGTSSRLAQGLDEAA